MPRIQKRPPIPLVKADGDCQMSKPRHLPITPDPLVCLSVILPIKEEKALFSFKAPRRDF